MAVGAVMRQPDRDPSRLAEKRTFRPPFALSVGFGPVASTTKRRFPGRAVARQPGPVDPDYLVVVEQPLPPDLVEHTGLLPLLKATMRRRRASRSRSRSTRSTASRSAARAGSRPSRPGRARAAGDSPTDAPAAPATTARPAPTASPASANHRRSRQDPSKPPSSISATRSDFAIHARVPAYRDRPLAEILVLRLPTPRVSYGGNLCPFAGVSRRRAPGQSIPRSARRRTCVPFTDGSSSSSMSRGFRPSKVGQAVARPTIRAGRSASRVRTSFDRATRRAAR